MILINKCTGIEYGVVFSNSKQHNGSDDIDDYSKVILYRLDDTAKAATDKDKQIKVLQKELEISRRNWSELAGRLDLQNEDKKKLEEELADCKHNCRALANKVDDLLEKRAKEFNEVFDYLANIVPDIRNQLLHSVVDYVKWTINRLRNEQHMSVYDNALGINLYKYLKDRFGDMLTHTAQYPIGCVKEIVDKLTAQLKNKEAMNIQIHDELNSCREEYRRLRDTVLENADAVKRMG